jgi:hypothetical protein
MSRVKHNKKLIQQKAATIADQMLELMIANREYKRWLDMPENATDQFIIVFNMVERLRTMFGPAFRHFLTNSQKSAFIDFANFCFNLDRREDIMCAKPISFEDFEGGEMQLAEEDYAVLVEYGNRLYEAKKNNQRERVKYLLRGVREVHRLVFDYKPDNPDAIDRELDKLAEFFNDNG